MAVIEEFFPHRVYMQENLLDDESHGKCLASAEKLYKSYDGDNDFGCLVWSSINEKPLHNDPEWEFLTENVSRHLEWFGKYFDAAKPFQCEGAWLNVYERNFYQEKHTHPRCQFSAVYFLEADEDAAPLAICNPLENQLPIETSEGFDTVKIIPPKQNSLIIFPSYLPHYVPSNVSGRRMTVAFNYLQSWQ